MISIKMMARTLMLIWCTHAWAAGSQHIDQPIPPAIASAKLTGDVPGMTALSLAISLPLRNQQGLDNLVRNLSDPNSSQYRQYLTPEQFADQFGPTPEQYQA